MAYPSELCKPKGIPGTHWNSRQARDSTLHADARTVAAEVTDFLTRHTNMNAHRLSAAAGLSTAYVSKLLAGDTLEIRAEKAKLLRRAMRRIDRTGA